MDVDLDHAQSTYDRSKDDVEACDTTRCEDLDDIRTDHTGPADQSKTDFDSCKGDEQIEYDNMTWHCDNVDSLVNGWNSGLHCPVPDFTNGDTDAVETYMTCICAFVEMHKDNYYDLRQKCIDATAVWVAQVLDCQTDQNTMGTDHCHEQQAIQTMCHDYKLCRDREEGEHDATTTTVEGWEEVMHAQRVSLEQLICFGNHILDNNTDLAGCDDLVHPDCTDYTDCPIINYDAPDPRMLCEEPDEARRPCTGAYEYRVCGAYSDETNVPCGGCVDCTQVVYPFTLFERVMGDGEYMPYSNCLGGGGAPATSTTTTTMGSTTSST